MAVHQRRGRMHQLSHAVAGPVELDLAQQRAGLPPAAHSRGLLRQPAIGVVGVRPDPKPRAFSER